MSEVVADQAGSSAKRRRIKEESLASEKTHETDGAESSASAPGESSPRRRLRKVGSNEVPVNNDNESLLSLFKPSEAAPESAGEADSDKSSKSSDEEVDEETDRGKKATDEDGPPTNDDDQKAQEGQEDAESDSESSSSSSSSSSASSTSSSSSSSSSEEGEPEQVVEYVEEEVEDDGEGREEAIEIIETPEQRIRKDYEACRAAQLRRKDLIWLLHQLPKQEAEKAIKRAWVRVTVQGGNVLAQVTDLEDVEPYAVTAGSSDRPSSVKVALKCRRCMPPERTYKLTNISNQEVTEAEFNQWIALTQKHGLDYGVFRSNWKQKVDEIYQARTFKFDDKTVEEMLQRKKSLGIDVEFDAQKESRLRTELQGSRNAMELCGLRNANAMEVEQRYQNGIVQIEELYQKSAKLQDSWFENRPNLYSLKEINMKNKHRQTARDKHALNYTYALEEEAALALAEGRTVLSNPFERRPCRPKNAWDTKLTETEGLDHVGKSLAKGKAPEVSSEAPAAETSTEATNGAKEHAPTRVDRRAHRDLLSMMSALMAGGNSSSGLTAVPAS